MARKKKHTWKPRKQKKEPIGPINEKMFSHERCPDCEYAERLDTVGLPIATGKVPLRKATIYTRRGKRTAGCQTCKGSGRLERDVPIDPMFQRRT